MTNVMNIVAQLDESPRLPYALRTNIVAQLDASPRLPYALRSNIVAQLNASLRLPYALRANIVAQLDASPRLPYALRSNPRILLVHFSPQAVRSLKTMCHMSDQSYLTKMLSRLFGHIRYTRDVPGSEHWPQTIYSEFIRGLPQLWQECIGLVPQINCVVLY